MTAITQAYPLTPEEETPNDRRNINNPPLNGLERTPRPQANQYQGLSLLDSCKIGLFYCKAGFSLTKYAIKKLCVKTLKTLGKGIVKGCKFLIKNAHKIIKGLGKLFAALGKGLFKIFRFSFKLLTVLGKGVGKLAILAIKAYKLTIPLLAAIVTAILVKKIVLATLTLLMII